MWLFAGHPKFRGVVQISLNLDKPTKLVRTREIQRAPIEVLGSVLRDIPGYSDAVARLPKAAFSSNGMKTFCAFGMNYIPQLLMSRFVSDPLNVEISLYSLTLPGTAVQKMHRSMDILFSSASSFFVRL